MPELIIPPVFLKLQELHLLDELKAIDAPQCRQKLY
jgi:hypothetical protein